MKSIITILGGASTVLSFMVGLIAAYNMHTFIEEWTEDHAKSEGFMRRTRLSTTAIFSTSLSDRCSRRRRKVLIWTSAFFVIVGVQALIILLLRSL
ncbi:hypothetical protein LMTR13_07115 [Bradyrhizobium icense]|uniref:Uncharacterized protein n=1 Tax=Bradyrhizobium icense TaxID=1274631 RepID=A0A1B1UBD9_9BRAD|nr:hypothetical protein LMTR13_07115 [Bradyrhizobium icense]